MSTERIYGGWSHAPDGETHNVFFNLWEQLSAQPGSPNFGLTQRKNEIIELWQLYVRAKSRVVVEIGVAQGGTFAGWCTLAHMFVNDPITLIGIDRDLNDCRPRPGDPGNPAINCTTKTLRMTCDGGGIFDLGKFGQYLHGINGWSHEPRVMEELLRILDGRKIDFLFHDASHSSDMFARDWQLYWPLVAEGGIFASHDINWSQDPKCDKKTAWEEIKRTATYSACYEYLPHPSVSEMGIGVLIK